MSGQQYTSAPIQAVTPTHTPEFFRLPARGPDPYFGLSRSYYYSMEKEGIIRMVRLRMKGKARGACLVPFAAIAEVIRNAGKS